MSGIDFSQTLTAETKAANVAQAHVVAVKAECRRRILAAIPFEAQQNIAQAVTVYAAEMVRGATEAEAEAASGLETMDFPKAGAGRRWIGAMQEACRVIAGDVRIDPANDTVWPALPEEVAGLVARF